MATSSITKDFVIEGKEQVEKFANAIEESYLESLQHKNDSVIKVKTLTPEEARDFLYRYMEKMKNIKKIVLFLIIMLMINMVTYANTVTIPAYYNKNRTYITLNTTHLPNFYKYSNTRFFFNTYVPDCVTQAVIPMNNDGITFTNNEKTIIFNASAGYNEFQYSAKWYCDSVIKAVGESSVTYSDYGNGWYVVSGVKNAKIYYIKGLVGNVTQSSIRFIYPYEQKIYYDYMIPILEDNFHQEHKAL